MRIDNIVRMLASKQGYRAIYLTKEQVAEKYDITLRTLERWIARGWVHPKRCGRRVWFEAHQLERDLIASGRHPEPV